MADGAAPRTGQLISAGLASALACLPIYALLSVLAFSLNSSHQPTVLGFLGAMLLAIPFSLLAIIIWPVSCLVAASLFALTGRWLFARYEDHPARRWIWAIAGAVVGLLYRHRHDLGSDMEEFISDRRSSELRGTGYCDPHGHPWRPDLPPHCPIQRKPSGPMHLHQILIRLAVALVRYRSAEPMERSADAVS